MISIWAASISLNLSGPRKLISSRTLTAARLERLPSNLFLSPSLAVLRETVRVRISTFCKIFWRLAESSSSNSSKVNMLLRMLVPSSKSRSFIEIRIDSLTRLGRALRICAATLMPPV